MDSTNIQKVRRFGKIPTINCPGKLFLHFYGILVFTKPRCHRTSAQFYHQQQRHYNLCINFLCISSWKCNQQYKIQFPLVWVSETALCKLKFPKSATNDSISSSRFKVELSFALLYISPISFMLDPIQQENECA